MVGALRRREFDCVCGLGGISFSRIDWSLGLCRVTGAVVQWIELRADSRAALFCGLLCIPGVANPKDGVVVQLEGHNHGPRRHCFGRHYAPRRVQPQDSGAGRTEPAVRMDIQTPVDWYLGRRDRICSFHRYSSGAYYRLVAGLELW